MTHLSLKCAPYDAEELSILSQAYDLWFERVGSFAERKILLNEKNRDVLQELERRGAMFVRVYDGKRYYSSYDVLDDFTRFIRTLTKEIEQCLR